MHWLCWYKIASKLNRSCICVWKLCLSVCVCLCMCVYVCVSVCVSKKGKGNLEVLDWNDKYSQLQWQEFSKSQDKSAQIWHTQTHTNTRISTHSHKHTQTDTHKPTHTHTQRRRIQPLLNHPYIIRNNLKSQSWIDFLNLWNYDKFWLTDSIWLCFIITIFFKK